jgi:glycosyltransferase 2 family protein
MVTEPVGDAAEASALPSRLRLAWPWVKFTVGVVLLALLGWLVDWRRTVDILLDSNLGLVVLAAAASVFALIVSTLKWARLIRIACGHVDLWRLLRAYWIGTFFNNYLPSSVGGDVARILVLAPVAPKAQIAASVLVERLIGVVALAMLSVVCLLLEPPGPIQLTLALWLLVSAILGGSFLIWVGGDRLLAVCTRMAARSARSMAPLFVRITRVANAIAAYRRTPGELTVAFVWSLVFYGVLTLFQFTLLRAVGSTIEPAQVVLVAPLVPLISLLPVTVNGLGIAEGAFVLFYIQVGVAPDQAFAAALLRRLLTIATAVPGGLAWLGRAPGGGATRPV